MENKWEHNRTTENERERTGMHGEGVLWILHDSISPLRPNPEAVTLGRIRGAAVFKPGCFVCVVRKFFLPYPHHYTFKHPAMQYFTVPHLSWQTPPESVGLTGLWWTPDKSQFVTYCHILSPSVDKMGPVDSGGLWWNPLDSVSVRVASD